MIALYSDSVDYFDNGRRDRAYIKADVEKYIQRWPIRRDFIAGDIAVDEEGPHKEYAATFKLNFYAENEHAQWSKGQFAIRLDINTTDGAPKISGISEKVLEQHKGENAKAPENRQHIAQPRLLQAPAPSYPEVESAGATGSGRFAIDFDERGNSKSVAVIQSTGSGVLDANTVAALRNWHAMPGRPGKIVVPITYTRRKPQHTPSPHKTPNAH
jgi:TonB family protein